VILPQSRALAVRPDFTKLSGVATGAKVGIGTRGGKETSQKPAEVVAFNVQPAKTKNPVFAKR